MDMWCKVAHIYMNILTILLVILFYLPDGKATAVHFNCKYVEASAVMNLNVDDLLAGVVKQIRLTNKRNSSKKKRKTNCVPDEEATNGCIEHAARGIVNKILRKNSPVFRSCDNLLVL